MINTTYFLTLKELNVKTERSKGIKSMHKNHQSSNCEKLIQVKFDRKLNAKVADWRALKTEKYEIAYIG